jgi:formylglycine-generating enzyme required for sulfatase activity/tRNA A-37 threonylcarbamoyl transferase component Bud32
MVEIIGTTLASRYRVDAFIGRGGMAEVYKVWDEERATYLALKLLREDLAQDRIFLRRFKREAQTLAKLQHPNIVRFYGLEQDARLAFMLMDFVEGESLKAEIFDLDGEPMAAVRVIETMRPICSALHYAHGQGMVHCDVKPSNIMIKQSGEVLLADFGVARMTDAATATMVGLGTPAYMAPELVRGLDPTPQTDIYALGVVLFEMFTGGERPFTGDKATITGSTSEKVRWEQMQLQPPSPRRWNPDISPELEAVVLKCLTKEPEKRYPSTLKLLNELQNVFGALEEVKVAVPDEKPTYRPEPKKGAPQVILPERSKAVAEKSKRLPGWAIAGGLLVLMILGGGIGGTMIKRAQDEQATEVAIALGAAKTQAAAETTTARPTVTLTATVTMTATQTQTPTITQTPTSIFGVGSTMMSDSDGMVMVYVPEGPFLMGSDEEEVEYALQICNEYYGNCRRAWFEYEQPQHEVYLDAFWIDQTEVTNAMYALCDDAGVCDNPSDFSSNMRSSYYGNSSYDEYPVIHVNWYQAQDYCQWAGRRLPTEAEWEKAARSEDGRIYTWGDESPSCNLANNHWCEGDTVRVGSYEDGASPYGALDMVGNAAEWVADWYDSDYYDISPSENPSGPSSGDRRVLRGSSWSGYPDLVRAADRWRDWPVYSMKGVGFRCARRTSP